MILGSILALIPKGSKGVSYYGMKKQDWPSTERIIFYNREPYILKDGKHFVLEKYEYSVDDKLKDLWFTVILSEKEMNFVKEKLKGE